MADGERDAVGSDPIEDRFCRRLEIRAEGLPRVGIGSAPFRNRRRIALSAGVERDHAVAIPQRQPASRRRIRSGDASGSAGPRPRNRGPKVRHRAMRPAPGSVRSLRAMPALRPAPLPTLHLAPLRAPLALPSVSPSPVLATSGRFPLV
jgi:hypothetical protein